MSNPIPTTTELVDLAWRTFWTAAAAFLGTLTASGIDFLNVDVSTLDAAKIAAVSAMLTTVKAYVSNKVGTGTAGTNPAPSGLPQPVASNNAAPAGATTEIVAAGTVPPREPVITQDPPPVPPTP